MDTLSHYTPTKAEGIRGNDMLRIAITRYTHLEDLQAELLQPAGGGLRACVYWYSRGIGHETLGGHGFTADFEPQENGWRVRAVSGSCNLKNRIGHVVPEMVLADLVEALAAAAMEEELKRIR